MILEKGDEYNDFVNKLRLKLSKDFGVNPDEIVITYPERGSLQIQVIFQSDDFNKLDTNEFENKFRNEENYPELSKLKTIHTDVLMSACKLCINQLDHRGNRSSGWGVNEKRGNKQYNPPLGWIGIGLNVLGKYDDEDNTWIGMSNVEGEWCVAYHGVARNKPSEEVKDATGSIYKGGFRVGDAQARANNPDKYHPGKLVGPGVYCTPNPSTAECYSGISEINGKKYKTILMVRVKPNAIRSDDDDYWVVDGTSNDIRPYRILYKEC